MNPIKAFKKWLLNLLIPYIEETNKKKYSSENQRFRDLFKKRKATLIILIIILFIIGFGISKSFIIFTVLIACSPFFVIFWNSFGEQLIHILKFNKNKK